MKFFYLKKFIKFKKEKKKKTFFLSVIVLVSNKNSVHLLVYRKCVVLVSTK